MNSLKDKNKVQQIGGQEQKTLGQRFGQLLTGLFIALAVVIVISLFIFGGLYILGSILGIDIIVKLVSWFCKNDWLYLIVNILPIIIEIVGLVLSVFAVGIPIVGIGMFVEVLTIVCDFIRKDPGWKFNVGLGLFGLIPIIGLLGSFGKVFNIIRKLL